jgi:hypothetical protein
MNAKILLSGALHLAFVCFLVFYLGDFNPILYCFLVGVWFYIYEFIARKIHSSDCHSDQATTTSYLVKSKWQLLDKLNFLIFFTFFGILFALLDNFYTVAPALRMFFYFILPGYVFQKLLCFLRSRQK